jgi:hypothetical protein
MQAEVKLIGPDIKKDREYAASAYDAGPASVGCIVAAPLRRVKKIKQICAQF